MQSCHSKVSNFDLPIRCDEYILGFQVSMADVERMAVPDGGEDLSKVYHGIFFMKSTIRSDNTKKLATIDILQDQISNDY